MSAVVLGDEKNLHHWGAPLIWHWRTAARLETTFATTYDRFMISHSVRLHVRSLHTTLTQLSEPSEPKFSGKILVTIDHRSADSGNAGDERPETHGFIALE
jgi:hypothetical protein